MDPFWYLLADAVQNWFTTAAIVVAGVWAVYRFWIRRENETAIRLSVACSSVPYGSLHLVSIQVTISNAGSVAVRASGNIPAYEDEVEAIRSSGHLRLRKVSGSLPAGSQWHWFPSGAGPAPLPDDVEANLLTEYDVNGRPHYWLEPGESSQTTATLAMEAGTYMGMVTFIGDRGDGEFWRHLFTLCVPVLHSREADVVTV